MRDDERDTIPPMPSLEVPAVDIPEPGPDASIQQWGIYFAKVAIAATKRPVVLTVPIWISLAIIINAADGVIDMLFKILRFLGVIK